MYKHVINTGVVDPASEGILQSLFYSKRNKRYLLAILLISLIEWTIFKYIYPFPNFIHADSFNYLQVAYSNAPISLHPIGYSRFLRLVSVFTSSDLILVSFQYLLLQFAFAFFALTLLHFYNPGKWIRILVIATIAFNPVTLHLANLISSDGLFTALSFIWFSLLIWVINRPDLRVSIWQAVVLFLAFTIRYNALYYPFLSTLVLLLSKQSQSTKLKAISFGFLLTGAFYFFTCQQHGVFIGQKIFSPFSGWQLANNALYAYRQIGQGNRKAVPFKFRELDRITTTYFDTSRNTFNHPMEAMGVSTVYMWTPNSPLQEYMKKTFSNINEKDSNATKYKRWALAGPLLGEYGFWLIKQYPSAYIQYYIWPNMLNYYSPPAEFLSEYNMGRDTVRPIALTWFGYKSKIIKLPSVRWPASSVEYYAILIGLINTAFLGCLIAYFCLVRVSGENHFSILVIITAILWLFNLIFSIIASPIVLRYQLFPQLGLLPITLILADRIYAILSKERGSIALRAGFEGVSNPERLD